MPTKGWIARAIIVTVAAVTTTAIITSVFIGVAAVILHPEPERGLVAILGGLVAIATIYVLNWSRIRQSPKDSEGTEMSGRKEPPPPEQVHGDRRTKRRRQRGQEERSERPDLRPTNGPCPGCGVVAWSWCKIDCPLIDPLDYR